MGIPRRADANIQQFGEGNRLTLRSNLKFNIIYIMRS